MKLENLVCTLEQAKRLSELGVNVSPAFYHIVFSADEVRIGMECSKGAVYMDYDGDVYTTDVKEYYPAYTVAELGVMLNGFPAKRISGATESFERAEALIYLLENKHVTAEEVNKRLQNA